MKRLACLCPTYKRPKHLANALACFLAQDYDPEYCRLFILDDAGQFAYQSNLHWQLSPSTGRFATLPDKYNSLALITKGWKPDGYVVWEDDDVFLPWHLKQINEAFEEGVHFYHPPEVYGDYGHPKDGTLHLEGAAGRFHSSWAFTVEAFDAVGGYPDTDELPFDQMLNRRLLDFDPTPWAGFARTDYKPSYAYRWGNGLYHGSQAGDSGYKALWAELGRRPAEWVGLLKPEFDDQTKKIFEKLGVSSK